MLTTWSVIAGEQPSAAKWNIIGTNFALIDTALSGGWNSAQETWTYASASTFTVPGVDVTAKYTLGTKIRWKQGGSYKYGHVASSTFSTNTTVTIIVNTDYVIANSTITDNSYSYASTPQGFPRGFAWTPVATGFSGTPTVSGRYTMAGTRMQISGLSVSGTSNATSFTVSNLPLNTKAIEDFAMVNASDNGVSLTGATRARVTANSAVVTFFKDASGAAWTGSGAKSCNVSFGYEPN